MGPRKTRETMMKSFAILALTIAIVTATVPEETFVQEGSMMTTFDEASARIEAQASTEAGRSACVKAADASINGVFRDVKNAQRMLNRLNNGRHCATRNQHLINRAKRTISTRTRWNFSFESLREGSCAAFYRSGQWQGAKRRV